MDDDLTPAPTPRAAAGAVPRVVVLTNTPVPYRSPMYAEVLRQRRMDQMEQQLPDALQMLAGGMKAGVSLSQAIQQLVREAHPPLSQEFDLLLREQRLGVSMDQALENLHLRVPLQ